MQCIDRHSCALIQRRLTRHQHSARQSELWNHCLGSLLKHRYLSHISFRIQIYAYLFILLHPNKKIKHWGLDWFLIFTSYLGTHLSRLQDVSGLIFLEEIPATNVKITQVKVPETSIYIIRKPHIKLRSIKIL